MEHIDIRAVSLEVFTSEVGRRLHEHAKQQGEIKGLSKRSGVPRNTLFRLFRGEPVGTEALFRVLRALDRWDVLVPLVEPVRETPLEKLSAKKKNTRVKPASGAVKFKGQAPTMRVTTKLADADAIKASLKGKKK